ncbi:hypothetical protein [Mesorhizobium sp. M00.F.Ca.ET.216.01.1.1]|uniref:hypothetical protein n=1 Tax=Mesorhizobium sp. M00.F.Ca.ET.216.01.1.1 TaxID=2500528 RepID=UPI000FDADEE9|nr:hypothetical protein [Mesorhizobium sp. M00.F.Ca.ET.216.01.1.1]TGQ47772.1 hypothetical protein EN859_000910 [Mesorhizobium sp. M00.F.Ca.ET.216.01.1.1]TJW17958.1 MAG: hypothetical protein E5W82_02985 [Mesorhizobium sp.]TJW48447.1 MAG: hypothetical protein E5W83_03100 [Mesorhizobium sp.]
MIEKIADVDFTSLCGNLFTVCEGGHSDGSQKASSSNSSQLGAPVISDQKQLRARVWTGALQLLLVHRSDLLA